METKICAAIIVGVSLICLFIWSSYNVNLNSHELLRAHLMSPAKLYGRSKLLCWVMTVDLAANFDKRLAVKRTWGRRCDKLLIVTNGTTTTTESSNLIEIHDDDDDDDDYDYGSLLRIPLEHDSRDQLWHKVVAAFTYIERNYLDQYDWFMKADDDTYVVVEHLKYFLRQEDPEEPIYFGARFKPFVKQGYMSGGAGYVLSRKALKSLVEQGFGKRLAQCHLEQGKVEDVEMGLCLEAVGVGAGDTRDSMNKQTFLPLPPMDFDRNSWYFAYDYYGNSKGKKSALAANFLTNRPISFHYIEPRMMYFIDYLIYNVKRN